MFYKKAVERVTYKTSPWEFHLEKGSVIPNHKHPHGQNGYMISGRMIFTIYGEYDNADKS